MNSFYDDIDVLGTIGACILITAFSAISILGDPDCTCINDNTVIEEDRECFNVYTDSELVGRFCPSSHGTWRFQSY